MAAIVWETIRCTKCGKKFQRDIAKRHTRSCKTCRNLAQIEARELSYYGPPIGDWAFRLMTRPWSKCGF